MLRYIVRRFLVFIPLLFVMQVLVFSIMYLLPGDPVEVMIGGQGLTTRSSKEQIQALREELGLTDPMYVQLFRYVAGTARGDLGRSIFTRKPVTKMIAQVLSYTLQLITAGMLFAAAVGITLGTLAALRASSWIDNVSMFVTALGIAVPDFWLGLLLIFAFALRLGWLPALGQGGIKHLILPALTLGTPAMALIARMTRSSILEVLHEEYVTTARAKGLKEQTVVTRHVFRNALIPIVTILSLQVGRFIAGSVVVETVFARQGIGKLLIESILNKDYPVVQGTVLLIAASILAINLIVDVLYAVIDPRIVQA